MFAISCINLSYSGNAAYGILINPGGGNQLNFTQTTSSGVGPIGFITYPNSGYYPATINFSFLNAIFSTAPYVYPPP
jgi:hypothetical protein